VRSVQFLATELDRQGGLAEMPLARDQLEAYVLTTLLHAGRHQYRDALAGADDNRRLGRLAPVVDYIEAHADRELTPETLARIGCVSVRTLHAAFQDRLGESPMAYVRKVRLTRVRADLLRSDPQLVGVTQVATRWGFVHLSRFARQYREQFDELPSTTLHR
jgi:transcriptional regulator GlxA family with amidase domain